MTVPRRTLYRNVDLSLHLIRQPDCHHVRFSARNVADDVLLRRGIGTRSRVAKWSVFRNDYRVTEQRPAAFRRQRHAACLVAP